MIFSVGDEFHDESDEHSDAEQPTDISAILNADAMLMVKNALIERGGIPEDAFPDRRPIDLGLIDGPGQ